MSNGSGDGETLIFTCAGAAHPGQVANRVGVQLARQQAGKLFCIAAVAADRPEKMDRARKAKARVLIDGCEDECCRYIMEKAGLPVDTSVTGRPLPLTADLDAVAYRVVHEALMAALAGTRDATADVFVRYEPDLLEIEVLDDGEAVGKGSQDTAELEAVRKEVASLGGTLDAGPRDGRGYRVLAQLPYEPDWS